MKIGAMSVTKIKDGYPIIVVGGSRFVARDYGYCEDR